MYLGVQQLLSFYTARKLLWGSDFPYVLLGGDARNAFALEYAQYAMQQTEGGDNAADWQHDAGKAQQQYQPDQKQRNSVGHE